MQTFDGMHILDIEIEFNGNKMVFHPTLLNEDGRLTLIDTGFAGQMPQFRHAFQELGFAVENITDIIITHGDRDHIGELPEFVKMLGANLHLYAHEIEKSYVQGDRIFTKKATDGNRDSAPATAPTTGVQVTHALRDGEQLPMHGGITAIHTPGHTLGHVCLYLERYQMLVTGDALNVVNGALMGPNPGYSHDIQQATQSLEKLLTYDIRAVICYHGGLWEGNVHQRLRELLHEAKH